jgi:dienelactone hydrolase
MWAPALAAQDVGPSTRLAGTWQGTVGTSAVSPIRFTFSEESTTVHGTFDAPGSGVVAWPVRVSSDTGGVLRFALPNGWTFRARTNDSGISGTLTGNGKSAPFAIHRTKSTPPPYTEEEVVFRNGAVTLSGTVLSPRGKGPWPAVVFAHGSGEVDRTADIFLGDYLARRGIAVLLYDKRGVGKSTGEWRRALLQDLAADAVAGVRLMRARPRVDAKRIGVAGRSQGGQLAIISASRYPEVAFAIDISGSLVPPWKQMNYEAAANMTRDKLSKEDSIAAQAFMNEKWAVARTGQGWDTLAAHVRQIREAKSAWLPYVQVPDQLSDISNSWTGIMGFDYGPVLAHLPKPVLALFGSRDTSTPIEETVSALRAGLRDSRNPRGTIRVYPEADHSLLVWTNRTAELELPTYPAGYPEIIHRWILAQ